MASSVKCLQCGAAIPIDEQRKTAGTVSCPACDASFKIRTGSGTDGIRQRPFREPDDEEPDASVRADEELNEEDEAQDDLMPLPAPQRAARRKSTSERGRKPGKAKLDKRQAAKSLEDSGRWKRPALMFAALAGGVVFLLIGSVFLMGNKGPVKDLAEQQPAAPAAPAVQFDAAKFAVVETPLPDDELPPADPPPSVAPSTNASDAEKKRRDESPDRAKTEAASPDKTVAVADASTPLWNIPVDPPAAPPEPVAEDLEIPNSSVLASMSGPFALGAAVLLKETSGPNAAAKDAKGEAKKTPKSRRTKKAKPPATIVAPDAAQKRDQWRTPLFDLRTGKQVGEFATHVFSDSRLSPNGEFLITRGRIGEKDRTETDGVLYAWEPDEPEPAAEIKLPGYVAWIDFVADDRVAMLAVEPESMVQISDVATGEAIQTIKLEKNAFRPVEIRGAWNRDSNVPPFWYAPGTAVATVSPGGRYLAISGRDGVTLVSLADGTELGVMPVPQDTPERFPLGTAIDFSPDGKHLYLATTHRHSVNMTAMQPYFMVWDVATGHLLSDSNVTAGTFKSLPGPDEGTYLCSGHVLDTFAGQVVYGVPFLPIRLSGPDRYLAFVTEEPNKHALASKEFDRADYAAKAEAARGPIGPRPKVLTADRSGITVTTPNPPATWTPPPSDDVPREVQVEKAVLGQWPVALGDRQGVIVSHAFTMQAIPGIGERGRLEMYGQRVDLRTGKTLGEKKLLWPWIVKPDRHYATQPDKVAPPLAALMADDSRLALRDPADLARVDIWNEDFSRAGGLKPNGDATIDWLAWTADGKLLVIGAGALTAWDVSSGQALYEVQGGYLGPADYGPGRKWLAAAASDGVDLIDTNTGQCLGRCRREVPGDPFVAIAVAGDGKSLASICPGFNPPARGDKKPTEYVAHLWDLEMGRASKALFGERPLQALQWNSPRHLLVASGLNVALIDARHGEVAWSGVLDGLLYGAYREQQRDYFKATPDGRVWALRQRRTAESDWTENDVWAPQRIPDFDSPGVKSAVGDDVAYLTVSEGVRVEVDAGDPERSQAAARKIAGTLQRRGFTIAPGKWTLRVSHRATDGKDKLEMESGRSIPIPVVGFVWQLIGPDGEVGWESQTGVGWLIHSSKYLLGVKLDYSKFPEPGRTSGPVRIEKFNFGNQDVRTAIIEEQLEKPMKALDVPPELPARLIKVGASHKALPVTEMVKIE